MSFKLKKKQKIYRILDPAGKKSIIITFRLYRVTTWCGPVSCCHHHDPVELINRSSQCNFQVLHSVCILAISNYNHSIQSYRQSFSVTICNFLQMLPSIAVSSSSLVMTCDLASNEVSNQSALPVWVSAKICEWVCSLGGNSCGCQSAVQAWISADTVCDEV